MFRNRPFSLQRMLLLLSALALLGVVSRVEASDGMRGDRCLVGADDQIAEDFYFLCRVLEVRGTIDGDVIGVASEITVYEGAVITGDIWAAGGRIRIQGSVGDDIHYFGARVIVHDTADFPNERTDLVTASLSTELNQGAELPGDLLFYGYQAFINGTIGGDIDFGGEALIIDGTIEGRIDATVGDPRRGTDVPSLPFYGVSFANPGMTISDTARIGGDLAYRSAAGSLIPSGVVEGRVEFDQSLAQPDITKVEQPDAAAQIIRDYLIASIRDVFTLLLVGAIALRLVPDFVQQPAVHVRRRAIPSVGWGLIAFMFFFPVAIILLMFSLLILAILLVTNLTELTIVVGVAMLLFNMGMIGGFSFLLYFMGRVIISYVIGHLIFHYVLRMTEPNALRKHITILAMGTPIYALITNAPLPAVGLTVELITALAGIGAIVIYVRSLVAADESYQRQAKITTTITPEGLVRTPQITPMFEDISESERGMNNLPDGFSGFDDDW